MSHNPNTSISCPNCGYQATYNYCAQCGQETHLHKETFGSLITHFVGHYFHYDSKFWITMKTLMLKPGALTVAYINKQRARYVAPISLYILVSVVYFLISSLDIGGQNDPKVSINPPKESIENVHDTAHAVQHHADTATGNFMTEVGGVMKLSGERIQEDDEFTEKLLEHFFHHIPKVFFLMIPFVALFLKLLFRKRKEFFFVDHAIFSLHAHTFFFSLFFIATINPFQILDFWLEGVLSVVYGFYILVAMKRVYGITKGKAVWKGSMLFLGYGAVFLIAILSLFAYLLFNGGGH